MSTQPPMSPFLPRPPEGKTALVVVDVQQKLAPAMDPEAQKRLLRAARILIETARQAKWPIVVTEQYPQGLGPTIPEIATDLAAAQAGAPLAKVCFSACGADEFAARLGGAEAAVLVGMEAHVCVLETALDLLGRGVRVFVPWDGVASRREEDRKAALDMLRGAGAIVTTSESLAFQMLKRAGTPEFKAISARVK